MDASSKADESTGSLPSSSSRADSQQADNTQQKSSSSQASSESVAITNTTTTSTSTSGTSISSITTTSIRTSTPPKRNQSPQLSSSTSSSHSQDVNSSSAAKASPLTETTKTDSLPNKSKEDSTTGTKGSTSSSNSSGGAGSSGGGNSSSNSSTAATPTIGMKRPPSESLPSSNQILNSGTNEQADSDSSGDPKRKKMRKETKGEDSPIHSGSSTPVSSSSGSGSRSRGGGTPKPGKSGGSSSSAAGLSSKGNEKGSSSATTAGASNSPAHPTFGSGNEVASTTRGDSSGSFGGISSSGEGPSQPMETDSNTSEDVSFSGARVKQVDSGTSSGSGTGSSNSGGVSGNTGSGAPKVPPIKIVLHPNIHGNVNPAGHVSGSSAGSGISVTESDSSVNVQHSSTSGFAYVVSSTTDSSSAGGPTSGGVGTTGKGQTGAGNTETGGSAASEGSSRSSPTVQTAGQFQASSASANSSPSTVGSTPVSSSTSAGVSGGEDVSTTEAGGNGSTSEMTGGGSAPSGTGTSSSSANSGTNNLGGSLGFGSNVTASSSICQSVEKSGSPAHSNASSSPGSVGGSGDKDKAASNKEGIVGSNQSSTSGRDGKESSKNNHTYLSVSSGGISASSGLPGAGGSTNGATGLEEKPTRVTRSSQRNATHGTSSNSSSGATPNSPAGNGSSPKTSNCPSPNQQDSGNSGVSDQSSLQGKQQEVQDKLESVENSNESVHPRKRKIKPKEVTPANSSSSSTSGDVADSVQNPSSNQAHDQPILNCFEMFLNIRKQIERRRKNLFPVTPKPPQGFKDYLMNRGTYVLASNAKSRLAIPLLNPPPSLPPLMKEMFIEQEKERHKLRIQHLVEKEKLVLSVEQEILRVHGRAARALSNQALPFSVCTILKDQEVYNLLTPEQEEKDRNARSRYNGRLFLSWLQDVDDKWDKIKESMLLRHHNEAESLHAVQKMDWEWKLKEVGLCEPKATPVIDDIQVPMVHVSDDFDLLPA